MGSIHRAELQGSSRVAALRHTAIVYLSVEPSYLDKSLCVYGSTCLGLRQTSDDTATVLL